MISSRDAIALFSQSRDLARRWRAIAVVACLLLSLMTCLAILQFCAAWVVVARLVESEQDADVLLRLAETQSQELTKMKELYEGMELLCYRQQARLFVLESVQIKEKDKLVRLYGVQQTEQGPSGWEYEPLARMPEADDE